MMFSGLLGDLLGATRGLRRTPAYAFFVIACLTLGVGSTTAVFTVLDGFVLKPLPFPEADDLLGIWMTVGDPAGDTQYFVNPQSFTELQREASSFDIGGYQETSVGIWDGESTNSVRGAYMTSNLFDLLGVRPLRGRSLTLEDEQDEAHVCIVSEEYWRSTLGGSSSTPGDSLRLNDQNYQVVGIIPKGLGYPNAVDIWIPMTRTVREGRNGIATLGRLRERVTVEQAAHELQRVADALRRQNPVANASRGLAMAPLGEALQDSELVANLWALMAVVGLLLTLSCANLACLVLVRIEQQQTSLAIRSALGAGRARLVRTVLVESGILVAIGCGFAVLMASLAAPLLLRISPAELPRFRSLSVDGRVVAFAILVSFLTLTVFSLLPAVTRTRGNLATYLKAGGQRGTPKVRAFQRLLVVADVALAVLLVSASTLLLMSFSHVRGISPGFDPSRLLKVQVSAPLSRSGTHEDRLHFMSELEEQLRQLPGIESVGSTHSYPVGGLQYWISFLLEDRPEQSVESPELGLFQIVTPGFFGAVGLRPTEGRLLESWDRQGQVRSAVVSESFARRYSRGGTILGERFRSSRASGDDSWWSIVGVVPDLRDRGLSEETGPTIYFPLAQFDRAYTSRMDVFLSHSKAAGSFPGVVRSEVRNFDPNTQIRTVSAMTEILADSLRSERFAALLSTILGLLALLIAGAGICGVLAYSVRRRQRELGLRLALGAKTSDIQRMVIDSSLRSVGWGLVVGNLLALGLARSIGGLLHGVTASDPMTILAPTGVICGVAFLASLLPARRTGRVDPASVLRETR